VSDHDERPSWLDEIHQLRPPWVDKLFGDLAAIRHSQERIMSAVQIEQSDLDAFAASVSTAATTISGYLTTLLANQATPLPEADESALTAAVASLTALEPPVVTPSTDTPPATS
jgi:hypothetical protein